MKMMDCVYLHKKDGSEVKLFGVYTTVQMAIETDQAGHYSNGKMVIRIPEARLQASPACGDRIRKAGDTHWYTVTEIQDNRKKSSTLSHWKLVCRG